MKSSKLGLFILLILSVYSCDYLDPEEYTIRTSEQLNNGFYYYSRLRAGAFSDLPNGYNTIGTSWLASACDEAEDVNETATIQSFNTGNWNQFQNPDDRWSILYSGIRKTFDFILVTNDQDWEEYRLTDPTEYEKRVYYTNMYRNEMSFLRAFYYFELIKRYAGVPLVTKKIDVNQELPEVSQMQRTNFSDCVDYIVSQCDSAAKVLLESHGLSEAGSPTKGAALALKSRVLLYAASDLFNKPNNADPILGYTDSNRQLRYIKAAEAALDVLNLVDRGIYALNNSYKALFQLGSAQNKEVIFERRMGQRNDFEMANYPITFNGGKTGTCPSQNLVNAYEMKDTGEAFDWNNPTHRSNPYDNRDPRLDMTIVTNHSRFNGRTIELWNGGMDGEPIDKTSKTGYYLRKYVVEDLDFTKNMTAYHQWIYFRLAEIYLNYAEAMNEAYGPDYKDGKFILSAREAVNKVRDREDVKMPEFPLGMSKENFRNRLRNERFVELAFEDHRYWDIRRWNMAKEHIGGNLEGVKIAINGSSFDYNPFVVEVRTYNTRMDLYPIPEAEIVKSKGKIVQNPDW